VIRNSSFDGVKGFHLGRHHYEAQFYLLDCTFSENMADRPIYRVVYEDSNMNRPFNWGERYYYFDCKKEGEEFSWIRDNLYAGKASLLPEDITPRWTFDDKWDPESTDGPKIISYRIDDKSVIFTFNEKITVSGNPTLETVSGEILYYNSGGGSDTIRFTTSSRLTRLTKVKLTEGQLTGSTAGVHKRAADFNQLP
jgi:pectinesterase